MSDELPNYHCPPDSARITKPRSEVDPPAAGSAFWVLFEHMSQEHGLTLLDSELSDICHAVDRMREKWKADEAKRRCRKCWGRGQVEIQSGPYYRTCDACGGSGQNKEWKE